MIRCYVSPETSYRHVFLKRDIIGIAVTGNSMVKLVVKNKPPFFFLFEVIEFPSGSSINEVVSTLNGWLTEDVCCGNYEPPIHAV